MPNLTRSPFDIGGKFFVRKGFATGGVRYERGVPFPWRRLGITKRRLRQMYEAGWLGLSDTYVPPPKEKLEEPAGA